MNVSNMPPAAADDGNRATLAQGRQTPAENLAQAKCELSELGQKARGGVSTLISRHPFAAAAVGVAAGLFVLRWRGARSVVRLAAAWGVKAALQRMLRG